MIAICYFIAGIGALFSIWYLDNEDSEPMIVKRGEIPLFVLYVTTLLVAWPLALITFLFFRYGKQFKEWYAKPILVIPARQRSSPQNVNEHTESEAKKS